MRGDWAIVEDADDETAWFVLGRGDDAMNAAGQRFGPAEFESAVVSHAKIKEAAAIAVPDAARGDVVVVLAVAHARADESDLLRAQLFAAVDRVVGKSLRPKAILFVDDLPRTRNLDVIRHVVRGRFLGQFELGDLSALDNPAALAAIDARR